MHSQCRGILVALCGFAAASVEGAVFRGRQPTSPNYVADFGLPAPAPAPAPMVAGSGFQAGDIVQASRELTGGGKVLVHAGVKGVVLGPAADRFGRPAGQPGELSVRFDERADLGGVADILHVLPDEIEAASAALPPAAAPASSLVPLATAVYRGCYENKGANRITGHASDLSFEECQQHAASDGKMYFAFEFPQGSSTHGRAQCLMLSDVPSSMALSDSECEQEQHNGHRLGAQWRIAVYGPEAPAPPAAAPAWPSVAPLPMTPATPMPTHMPLLAGSLCATASSCSRCTALTECGWCAMEQKCVEGTKLGPRTEQCLAYDYMHCTNIQCEARNTCTDCLSDRECGWCASKARCAGGDARGPFTASSCPAPQGFVGGRPVWAHTFSVTKCQDTPPLHASELWDNLRGIMYRSQTRIARMQAKAVPIPPLPVPVAPPPVATPAPQYVATTWIVPTAPVVATTTTEALPTTTVARATPCPTQTMPLSIAPPPRSRRRSVPQPPIEIKVDVDQHVNNEATAKANSHGDINPQPQAPAAAAASSPGLVVQYAPAPAVEPEFPAVAVPAGPPPMPEYPAEEESAGPPLPGGGVAIEAPSIEAPPVEIDAPSLN